MVFFKGKGSVSKRRASGVPRKKSPLQSLGEFLACAETRRQFGRLCGEFAKESPHAREALGTLLFAVFHGHAAWSQLPALRQAPSAPALLGIGGFSSPKKIREALTSHPDCRLDASFQNYRHAARKRRSLCDWHVGIKPTRFGRRWVHSFLETQTGFCLGVRTTPGKAEFACAALSDFLSSGPRPRTLRGPAGQATEEILHTLERFRVPYLFPLGSGFPGEELCSLLPPFSEWPRTPSGDAVLEIRLRHSDWKKPRRIVLAGGTPDGIQAIVTSLRCAPDGVLTLHRQRLQPCNPFDPEATEWAWSGFQTESLYCSQKTAQFTAIVCNWWHAYQEELAKCEDGFPDRIGSPVPLCLVLLGAFILMGSGLAQRTLEEPLESSDVVLPDIPESVLSLMAPADASAGGMAVDAATWDELAPLPDPNVDDVPPLAGEQLDNRPVALEGESRLWRLRPILSSAVTYDDNIFLSPTDRRGDVIFNINAGLALEFGDYENLQNNYLLLEYVATGYFFNRYTEQNSFNQAASLIGQYRFEALAVQLESRYQTLSGAERQVGAFTDRVLLFNALRLIRQQSEKTSLDFEVTQRTNYYPENLSSSYYETVAGFDYQIFPKTRAGLEAIFGLAQVQDSPDMWYQTLNGRFEYLLTGKTLLKATGGLQFNEYIGGGEPLRLVPVFSIGAEHALFNKTRLNLVAYRNLQASPSIADQDYIATGGEIGVSQDLTSKLQIGFTTGFENDTYVANSAATDATRVDNFYFFRPSITYEFLKYLKASLSYEYRANDSSISTDTWNNNRATLEISAQF